MGGAFPAFVRRFQGSLGVSLALLWFCGVGPVACASAENEEMMQENEETVTVGELTGTVSSVGKNFINVEYSKGEGTSYERFLPLSDKVHLENLQSVQQLKFKDKVRVQYQQTYRKDPDGKKVVLKTIATSVVFLKGTEQSLRSAETAGLAK